MKKDIAVIRESIGKIVNLLTRKSIKVTMRGVQAYVSYNKLTGAIQGVNLPYLPDNASDEFVAAVQGFLDHEVGHVLFTDANVVRKAAAAGPRVKNLANVLEDVYIENKITEAFRGSVNNLESVRRFHVDKMALPKIQEALARGEGEVAAGYMGAIQFRAWGGQRTAIDFIADHPELQSLTAPLAAQLGPELIARVAKLKSSEDSLKLAIEIVRKTTPPPPPPAPPAPSAPPSSKPEKGDDAAGSGDTEPDPDYDEERGESEDEGTTTTEADDSGKERDEASKTDEEGEGGGDVDGDGDAGADEGKADSAGAADDEEDDEDAEGSGVSADDEPVDDTGGAGEGDEAESRDEPADGMAGGDATEETDEGDGGGAESDAASGEEGEGAEDDTGAKTDKAGKHLDSSSEDTVDGSEEDLGTMFDAEHDFDSEAGKMLSAMASRAMRDATYRVFSAEWDKVEPAPPASSAASVTDMVDTVQHMVGGMQKHLERAMAAQDKKTWNPGQRRGRISPGGLYKTATGDDRVFRRRHVTQAKNTAVSLLVDCSGSMGWDNRIKTAGLAAYALSSTLERLKIQHEVIGFTTVKNDRVLSRAISAEEGFVRYSRLQPLYMPVFKGFHERLGVEAKSRLAHLTERPRWLNENVDGESVQIAAHRLSMQRAERHVLIVLSDGSPACPGDAHAQHLHLKDTVQNLEKRGIEVIGIGIDTDAVRTYYPRNLVLRNLEALPGAVMGQLTKLLLAP